MNAQEIISAIIEGGAKDSQSILDALCDGAALAAIGVTDDDQEAVEQAYSEAQHQKLASGAMQKQ